MVYVIQEQGNKNILPAVKYGELKILLPPDYQITFSPGQVTKKLMVSLSDFNDDDYLLLIGDPAAIGIATAIAAHWNCGRVKMLKWDRQEKMYYPITFNLYIKGGSNGDEEKITE